MTKEKIEAFERYDVRLPSRKVQALKRLADKKNYEEFADSTWVDHLRRGIDLVLQAEGIDPDAAPEKPKATPPARPFDPEQFRVPPSRAYGPEPHRGVPAKDRQSEVMLLPSRRDAETQSFILTPQAWTEALKLSKRGGYSPDADGGMNRQVVQWFRKGLATCIERGRVPKESMPLVEALLQFCDEEGRFGFTLQRRWKSARKQAEEGA